MRIFNRSHFPWFLFVLFASAVSCWIYVGNFFPARLSPALTLPPALVQKASEHHSIGGTPVGLAFGAVALAIFIFGALLSLRKRVVLWRIGSVQSWMRAHIWLTLLTIPLVALHSGFRLGGLMTIVLLAFYAVVMLSGIYGLILQHRMPALMPDRLPNEKVYEQIPYLRAQLFHKAERLRDSLRHSAAFSLSPVRTQPLLAEEATLLPIDQESEAALLAFLENEIMPYLKARRGRRFGLRKNHYADDAFRFLNLSVGDAGRAQVEEMRAWCDERRALDLQTRMHHWLHGWLFVHVPFSFLLILLTAWHAVVTLFYY